MPIYIVLSVSFHTMKQSPVADTEQMARIVNIQPFMEVFAGSVFVGNNCFTYFYKATSVEASHSRRVW
jgi:hypothetical protein